MKSHLAGGDPCSFTVEQKDQEEFGNTFQLTNFISNKLIGELIKTPFTVRLQMYGTLGKTCH